MSVVWVTSDWHLGHRNISKFRHGVSSSEDNDNILISNYKSLVKSRDLVWFLGDISFDLGGWEKIASLPGEKKLVLGNHDSNVPISVLLPIFNKIFSLVSYKNHWLSHAPLHPDELRGKRNLHGHCHHHVIDDPRYINICVDQTDMKPVKFQDLIISDV